jgi:hypothetical protein
MGIRSLREIKYTIDRRFEQALFPSLANKLDSKVSPLCVHKDREDSVEFRFD